MRPSIHHGAIGALALSIATGMVLDASAARADTSCQGAVDQAESSWRALSLDAPDKPAQAHVPENHASGGGHTPGGGVNGALYTYLADQLRFAAARCRDGREAEARAALLAFTKALPPHAGASRG